MQQSPMQTVDRSCWRRHLSARRVGPQACGTPFAKLPGRYELELPAAPLRPELATLRDGERVIERFAIAGRYAGLEFDAVGTDRENLNRLASQTGGRVIEANETRPIDFRWPRREVSLTAWLAAGGAVLILASMLWWRWG